MPAVLPAAGRHRPPVAPHRLPSGRDRGAEMVRGRRRHAQARGNQDRIANGVAERAGPDHPGRTAARREPLRISLAERSRKAAIPQPEPVATGTEGSRDRGRPAARPAACRGQPGRRPGRRTVDGGQNARPCQPDDDIALGPCRRPRRRGRRGADRNGDRRGHGGRLTGEIHASHCPWSRRYRNLERKVHPNVSVRSDSPCGGWVLSRSLW